MIHLKCRYGKASTLNKLWNFIFFYFVLKSESLFTSKNLAIISTNLAPINLNDFKRISLKFWKIRSHLILIYAYIGKSCGYKDDYGIGFFLYTCTILSEHLCCRLLSLSVLTVQRDTVLVTWVTGMFYKPCSEMDAPCIILVDWISQ